MIAMIDIGGLVSHNPKLVLDEGSVSTGVFLQKRRGDRIAAAYAAAAEADAGGSHQG